MNQNIIVTLPSKELRAIGRDALRGGWKAAAIVTLLYYVLLLVPQELIQAIFYDPFTATIGVRGASLAGLYTLLVSGAFEFGYSLYILNTFRKKEANNTQLFAGFEMYLKVLGLSLYQFLFIFLWSLLLVVPGIIAAIRYSQSTYILIDHPEYSIPQCVEESKRMMKGNKAEYFFLGFSFIGWAILASIPVSIVEAFSYMPPATSMGYFFRSMLVLVFGAGYLFLFPYQTISYAAFYEIMAGNLKPSTTIEYEAPQAVSQEAPAELPEQTAEPAPEQKDDHAL